MRKIALMIICLIIFLLGSCNKTSEYEVKKIVYKEDYCADALDYFYSDELNDYYFTCIKSPYITIYYTNGQKETLENAFANHHIQLEDLDKFNISYCISPKEKR